MRIKKSNNHNNIIINKIMSMRIKDAPMVDKLNGQEEIIFGEKPVPIPLLVEIKL